MRSIFFIISALMFCENIFSQISRDDSVLAFIHSDISKYADYTISEGVFSDYAPTALKTFIHQGIPDSLGSFPKNAITFIQEGYANQDYYTFLSTRFSPEIVSRVEIRKQIYFLDFPDLFQSFEVRVYQISSESTPVDLRIYWKKTTESSYHSFNH